MVIGSANCFSQQYPFVHYTPREGLANNRTRFIFQDSKGKLYISTYGGLSVYDGSRFINYNTNNGLAVDLINDVVEMGEDSIWILTNANRIHCLVKGKLKDFIPSDHFTPLVNQLIKCSDGYYYAISDEGLFRLENRRFIPIKFQSHEAIRSLSEAVEIDKKLYILSNPEYKLPASNLLVYDLPTNKLISFNKNILASHLFYSFQNGIWIATVRGMFLMNKITGQNDSITLKPIADIFRLPKDLGSYFIYRDHQNNTWLATTKGVYKIKRDGGITSFTIENGLTTNFQTSIFQDYENNIWFTNELTGLTKLSNQQLAYYKEYKPGYSISDIYIPPLSDSVWMHDITHHCTMLLLPDGSTKAYFNHHESLGYPARLVAAATKWVLDGLTIFQWKAAPNGKQYSLSPVYKDSTNTIGFGFGMADRNGNLVTVSNKLVVAAGKKIISAPVYYLADQLAIDRDNKVWVAPRSNYLFCFQISDSGTNTKLSLLKTFSKTIVGSPRSIVADQKGNIWIGTRDQGLYCLHFDNLKLKSIRQLTTQNGLSENFVSYLYCDKGNNIWACTPSGFDEIKIDANDHFLIENITRSSNLYLRALKIQQTNKGLFWILTADGIITYNPERSLPANWKPQLSFSEILINNINQTSFANGELSYFQNNIVFQLSAPTYIDEKLTRFSYVLEGSGNKDWSLLSSNASVNLVNLPPGHYTLKAKAIFLHGLYPDAESSYSFNILPPWWQTVWFKTSLALLIAGLLFLSIRFYFKRKLQLQLALLEKKQAIEKERTRIATDMHDDLGAGLSRIKFLSETIGMKKQQHLPIEEEISSIRAYSHEMIDKMGEIVWALNEKNDSLEDLLSYTRSYAVEYLQENGIHCRVNEPDIIPEINVSGEFRRNIYLTVKETLHNIVKHAQATEVFINIEINHWLIIDIRDNGKGIGNVSTMSAGNGLLNMNARIQGLKGSFKIENNNGTQVSIKVPLAV